MIGIELKVDNSKLRKLMQNLDADVQTALEQTAPHIEAAVKGNAPVRTGKLRDSIEVSVERKAIEVRGARYGTPVNVGRPHPQNRHFVDEAVVDEAEEIGKRLAALWNRHLR